MALVDGKQVCPVCGSKDLWTVKNGITVAQQGMLKFVKQCKGCSNYSWIIRRL